MGYPCRKRNYLCRPPPEAVKDADFAIGDTIIWRLGLNGHWAPDNGKPGLAFAAGIMHYYPDAGCQCTHGDISCISEKSRSKVLQQYSTANGQPIEAKSRRSM